MRFSVIVLLVTTLFLSSYACSEESESILENKNTNSSVGPPATRSEVILTADKYVRLHWTMSAINRTGTSCEGNFLSNYPEGDRVGMAYKWGGWNDIDDFLQKIDEGYGAGTGAGANVYDNVSIDCVVGVSCTGLVSRAWNLNQKYTLCYSDPKIPRKFCEITQNIEDVDFLTHQVDALKKGDAFINDVHTILFVYETRAGHPKVMDSSYEGVRFRQLTWLYLASEGYEAIRYDNIRDTDNPAGTITNPIIINSDELPFIHEGNTRDVVSMEFDSYSTATATSQVGPEVIYELHMKSSGTITMVVTDILQEMINNDIHLLDSLERDDASMMATNVIERADKTITRQLDEGIYFIVVDSSIDLPGEYTVFVSVE